MPRARHKPKAAPGDPKTGAKNNFTKLRSGKKLDKPDNLGFNVASATDEELPPGVNGADGLKPAGDDAARECASATLRGSGLDTADAAHISQGSQRHARSSHGRDEPAPRSHRLEKPGDQGSGSSADAKPEEPGRTAASPSLLAMPSLP